MWLSVNSLMVSGILFFVGVSFKYSLHPSRNIPTVIDNVSAFAEPEDDMNKINAFKSILIFWFLVSFLSITILLSDVISGNKNLASNNFFW